MRKIHWKKNAEYTVVGGFIGFVICCTLDALLFGDRA